MTSAGGRRKLGADPAATRIYGGTIDRDPSDAAVSRSPESLDIREIVCPICGFYMVSVQSLNTHLETDHGEYAEAIHEIGVGSWLQRQITKSTKLNAVASIGKNLMITEEFRRNGSSVSGLEAAQDTDDVVSRQHWETERVDSHCRAENCDATKGARKYRSIHCRRCGKIYCEKHTLYQIRLSRSANYEPTRGIWCRVCKSCYEDRDWYSSNHGASTNHLLQFAQSRQVVVDRLDLDRNRLEKRLGTLLDALAKSVPDRGSLKSFFLSRYAIQSTLEQSIVPWDDAETEFQCRFCHTLYGYNNPKSHCRLCGKVVCGDIARNCSRLETFNPVLVAGVVKSKLQLRMCKNCTSTLFGSQMLKDLLDSAPDYGSTYSSMQLFKISIEKLLSRFKILLGSLTSEPIAREAPDSVTHEINRTRRRLLEAFAQYEATAKKVKGCTSFSDSDCKIQEAIYRSAVHFMQMHMSTLRYNPIASGQISDENQHEISGDPQSGRCNMKEQLQLHEEVAAFAEQKV